MVMSGSSFHSGVENDRLVEKSGILGYGAGLLQRSEVETQSWVPQQRSTVGHTDGEIGWRGKRLDETHGIDTTSQGRRSSEPARICETDRGANGTQRDQAN